MLELNDAGNLHPVADCHRRSIANCVNLHAPRPNAVTVLALSEGRALLHRSREDLLKSLASGIAVEALADGAVRPFVGCAAPSVVFVLQANHPHEVRRPFGEVAAVRRGADDVRHPAALPEARLGPERRRA